MKRHRARPRTQGAGPLISPRAGPAGTSVTVRVEGLLPEDALLIGFGGIGSPHEILGDGVADAQGVLSIDVGIPGWVEAGRTYLFYMAWADQRPVAFSEPYLATAADGSVEITGTVTDEGVTCVAFRGEDDTLYTLAGDTSNVAPGDRITIRGTVAEMSVCGQGITLAVDEISD